jgi:hypothetical protein
MLLLIPQQFLNDRVIMSRARLDDQFDLRVRRFELLGEVHNGRDDGLAAAAPDQDVADLSLQTAEPLRGRDVRVVVGVFFLETWGWYCQALRSGSFRESVALFLCFSSLT